MPAKRNHPRSSPSTSSSSHGGAAIYASDQFFAPEYPPADINSWRSGLSMSPFFLAMFCTSYLPAAAIMTERETSMFYPQTPDGQGSPSNSGYYFDSNLYASPHVTGQYDSTARVPSPFKISSSPSMMGGPYQDMPSSTSKKSRKDSGNSYSASSRLTGACTRCKRLKMKCSFADNDNTCARCIVGGHECVVLGRKPRSPGMRDILRKQIREKDVMIDNLLAKLNPASSTATPLAINPSKLTLTPEQRTQYRDILMYLDKVQGSSRVSSEAARQKIDLSAFDEEFEEDSESEGVSSGMEDVQESTPSFHLHPLPAKRAPAGVLAATALESRSRLSSPVSGRDPTSSGESDPHDDPAEGGITSSAYFEPGPFANLDLRRLIVERQAAPDIILSGLVNNDDVSNLFEIFYQWINPVIPIFDENIHTPAAVLGRCPFLFTVVCTVAARYYDEKPEIYPMAVHMTKAAAANAFLDGCKTLEMCQAFALMAAYMPPAKRWDEDRQFFYSALAFRLALDLELHRVPETMPADERAQREALNRLRTHIICFIIDRCFCINLGKPFMIPEDELIRSAAAKFLGHKFSQDADNYMVSLVELFRIMGRFAALVNPAMDSRADRNGLDLPNAHRVFSDELRSWNQVATDRCARELSPTASREDRLRMGLMISVYEYCRLVTFSVGLQEILKQGKLQEDTVFFAGVSFLPYDTLCLHAASAVVNCVVERILPTGFIRYSPEYVFALSAFGAAILTKPVPSPGVLMQARPAPRDSRCGANQAAASGHRHDKRG
ncbi:uncharacterized protein PHACADRAFT_30944 [Phanerochaete carnosa HHB-10118-sp]|uniref:Zn(2)-C6 fungal-type domain-containing protein n=1 Tax=Phanerochaete carnosa (strain HHB-10118-sp) TaxID=650164 RepID=K5W0M8_PHACS|nr:uncharacterized protein PHACADRAFT_30944 [Phanerochaete carnosa HHB-10118-sp]EKM52424.1 hypothetical protein PHACADRAFT_30944 [Phanerochaete carnosa HHB-10118-sp]